MAAIVTIDALQPATEDGRPAERGQKALSESRQRNAARTARLDGLSGRFAEGPSPPAQVDVHRCRLALADVQFGGESLVPVALDLDDMVTLSHLHNQPLVIR